MSLPLGGRWRILDSGAADGATNMAVDAALLDDARRDGVSTLRIYAWSTPTLSLGRHERSRGRFDPERLAAAGVGVVRRLTGGRALLHDHEVTYSVTAPSGSAGLRARYAAINRILAAALARLGVTATQADARTPTARPGSSACFAEPNVGELVVDGAKLVASAQFEEEGAFLQHGSILIRDDQARIAELSNDPNPPRTQAAALETLLARPVAYAELRDALVAALRAALDESDVTSPPVSTSMYGEPRADLPQRSRFTDPAWTWRR